MAVRVLEVMGGSTGGIGRHVAELVAGLDSPDLAVDVAAPPGLSIPMPKTPLPLDVPKRPAPGVLPARTALRRLVAAGRYDVIHTHGLRASLLGLQGASSRPVVATLHNLIRPEISGPIRSVLFRRGEKAVVRRAAHVFAVSEEMASELRRYASDVHKVEVLPIGIARPAATREPKEVRLELDALDRPLIVAVARLARQKALDVLLKAVARVDGAVLAIVGDGALRAELVDLAEELGITDRVRFLGWREQVGDYVVAADVFALSSTWEARALAAQEAILCGTPVVSTDVGGMPELIEDRVSGRLVPPNDAAALATALAETLADAEGAALFARRARDRLASAYSGATMLERVRAEYMRWADA